MKDKSQLCTHIPARSRDRLPKEVRTYINRAAHREALKFEQAEKKRLIVLALAGKLSFDLGAEL